MDERLKQAMKSYLDNRKRAGSPGDKNYKFQWRSGRNRFVLLPFMHRVEEADLLRSGRCSMGLGPDDLGKELPFLIVPRIRYHFGPRGKPTHITNGLGTPDCPLLQAWLSESGTAKDKRTNPSPQDEFVCNVVNMDQPERGVIQYGFKRTEWMGPLNPQGGKLAYGVWDLIAGFEASGTPGEEPREGEEVVGGSTPALPGVPPWDEASKGPLVGLKGREIILIKKAKIIGNSPVLVVDETVQGGPLRVGPNVDLPASFYGQGAPKGVRDLLKDPASYPGWSTNGAHLTEEADVFAARAVGIRRKTAPEVPADIKAAPLVAVAEPEHPAQDFAEVAAGIPDEAGEALPAEAPRLPPPEAAAPPLEPRPASRKPGRPRKRPPVDVSVGQTVHWTEGGTTYVGRVYKIFEEAGDKKAEIEVTVEDQQSEQARQDAQKLIAEHGPEAVAHVPLSKLVVA